MPGPVLIWWDFAKGYVHISHDGYDCYQLRNCHTETGECLCVDMDAIANKDNWDNERQEPRQRCAACEVKQAEAARIDAQQSNRILLGRVTQAERERDELVEALDRIAMADERWASHIATAALAKVGK